MFEMIPVGNNILLSTNEPNENKSMEKKLYWGNRFHPPQRKNKSSHLLFRPHFCPCTSKLGQFPFVQPIFFPHRDPILYMMGQSCFACIPCIKFFL